MLPEIAGGEKEKRYSQAEAVKTRQEHEIVDEHEPEQGQEPVPVAGSPQQIIQRPDEEDDRDRQEDLFGPQGRGGPLEGQHEEGARPVGERPEVELEVILEDPGRMIQVIQDMGIIDMTGPVHRGKILEAPYRKKIEQDQDKNDDPDPALRHEARVRPPGRRTYGAVVNKFCLKWTHHPDIPFPSKTITRCSFLSIRSKDGRPEADLSVMCVYPCRITGGRGASGRPRRPCRPPGSKRRRASRRERRKSPPRGCRSSERRGCISRAGNRRAWPVRRRPWRRRSARRCDRGRRASGTLTRGSEPPPASAG